MTHTLFIQLPSPSSDHNKPVDWALFRTDQPAPSQKIAGAHHSSLADAMAQSIDYPDKLIVALVPGHDIVQTHICVPAGQKRHLQRTLPFLVEEQIAAPIEEMHLCLGAVKHDKAAVSAVSHQTMQYWHQLLKTANIDVDWLLPDSAALTLGHTLEILVDNQGAYFSYPQQPIISADVDNLAFIADSLIEQHSTVAASDQAANNINTGKLWISQQLAESDPASAVALTAQFEVAGIALQQQQIDNHFDFCCAQLSAQLQQNQNNALVNLLSEPYQSTSKRHTKGAPKWRLLAMVAVICLLIKLAVDLGSGLYLNQQSDQLDDQINALYHQLFPQDKRIVNVKVQMQNHLNGQPSSAASSFMPLLSTMAAAIASLDNVQHAELQQLRYHDKTQTLLVDINVKDVQQLEQLKQRIQTQNVKASILSANEQQQWIKGRIRLAL